MNNRVITRERGVIPGCVPAGRDDHMVALKPDTTDAWLAQLRASTLASRQARGACESCGEQPKPKRAQTDRRYCKCHGGPKITAKFEASAA